MEEFISKTNTEDNVTELKNNVVPETNENRKSIRHRELLHSFIILTYFIIILLNNIVFL
jgi:hypothetical protein